MNIVLQSSSQSKIFPSSNNIIIINQKYKIHLKLKPFNLFLRRSTHQRLAHDVITIPHTRNMLRLRVHSKGSQLHQPLVSASALMPTFFPNQVLGPKLMENRKPFQLQNTLIVYNLFQVLFSSWLFYEVRIRQDRWHECQNSFAKTFTH